MSDEQNLAAALLELSDVKVRKGPACTVATLVDRVGRDDPQGAAALRSVVDSEQVAPAALSRLLADRGHRLGAQTIRRHRKRLAGDGCTCPG